MFATFNNLIAAAIIAVACLSACSPAGPDADTVVSVSYSIWGRAPLQTLTVDASNVRFESAYPDGSPYDYDTVVADAAFLNTVRSSFSPDDVRSLSDNVDTNKLAVDHPLLTVSIVYQVACERTQSTKVVKFTTPAQELASLYEVLSTKADELRRRYD